MKNLNKMMLNVFIVIVIFATTGYARKCKSCINGNWNSASTWIPASIPACGDTVIILAGNTVSVTTQQNYSACAPMVINVYGQLLFFYGSKLRLSCGSYVKVFVGGVIDHDVGLSSSNLIEICGIVEWNSNTTLN